MEWKVLFDFYNENHAIKLGIGCMPCYVKVRSYVKNQLATNA